MLSRRGEFSQAGLIDQLGARKELENNVTVFLDIVGVRRVARCSIWPGSGLIDLQCD
jgi:hypothetical protein